MAKETIRVLLVEDDPSEAGRQKKILAESRNPAFRVVNAESLQSALASLASGGLDIVLLDTSLTDATGFDAFSMINTQFPQIPIIILEDNSNRDLAVRTIRDGCHDCLVKQDLSAESVARAICFAIERHSACMARQKAIEQLQELGNTKSKFVAEASHELRTPLAIIQGFVSLVNDGIAGPLTDKQKECLDGAIRNVDRMTDLINKMLDLSQIEAGRAEINRTRTDIVPLLKLCHQDFLSKCAAKKQELVLEIAEGLPNAYCDGDKVVNILTNLLSNAWHFTPEGGKICIRCQREGQYLCASVQDNGRGIPRNVQEFLFQPFYQVDREYGPGPRGTGLGLAITKHLVGLNGGYMSLESEPGKGSIFSFMLPVCREEASKRVLVVDDEEKVVKLVTRYLKAADLNLDIKSTTSGYEALIISGQFAPDLVILDMLMADIGGKRVLEELKQKRPPNIAKVLLISGDPTQLADYRERGADDCLNKPFSSSALIKKVVTLLGIERRGK